jgi:hypothetical protein
LKSVENKFLSWPFILAAGFFLIPIVLFSLYPIGFWSSTDYEPLGLANALNMAYRLADLRLYAAEGMTNHPGVPFYLMSWLALALSGHPVAAGGQEPFFRDVVDHVEDYHRAAVYVAALAGSAGVYVFARTALKLIPTGATAVALLAWLVSTPATILCFMYTGFEPVGLLINALFLVVLAALAFDREINPRVIVLAGLVGAFAYLNKLAYVYVPLALACAIFWKACFCGIGWRRSVALIALSIFTFVAVVVATGYFIIGWKAFVYLLRFHRNVILGSGLYGGGQRVVVSGEGVWRAITAIPGDRAFAVPLALIAGVALNIAGVIAGLRNRQNAGVAVMAIGAGLAGLFSALSVMKHYDSHYTAGVAATLPGCVLACFLFARGWNSRARFTVVAVASLAILLMAGPVLLEVRDALISRVNTTRLAAADIKEVGAQTAGMERVVDFSYRVPFPQFVEGFVVHYAGVPRLTEEYVRTRGGVTNDILGETSSEIGAYVFDKNYFNAQAIMNAPNLDPRRPTPERFDAHDKLIELHTVFLLIRK